MEERTLELTIISAEDLKKVSTFGRETCYAVAHIYANEKKSTKVDGEGGVNPKWNSKLTLTCDDKLLQRAGSYIIVEIYSYGTFSTKLVGTSKISLVDVGKQAAGESRRLAFEVRRPSGKVKGTLNVSVRVGEARTVNKKKNQSGQGVSTYPPAGPPKQQQYGSSVPMDFAQAYPPSKWNTPTTYPPQKMSGYESSAAASNNAASVYPPPKPGSESGAGNPAVQVYPPPKPTDTVSTSGANSKKQEEPVMAYPATGVPLGYPPQQHEQQYGYGQQYGQQYGAPQYYYPAHSQGSYGYQQQYAKPSRWQGSSGGGGGSRAGLGLLGGVLGGLLLGDVIGDVF